MALGARRAAVMAMVIREALEQAAAGVVAGIPIAFAATRLMGNQLYGVSATDPRNAVVAAVVLVASLGLAASLVARRASRIDPIRALRQD
jgi:putative ABC transport system permease protein